MAWRTAGSVAAGSRAHRRVIDALSTPLSTLIDYYRRIINAYRLLSTVWRTAGAVAVWARWRVGRCGSGELLKRSELAGCRCAWYRSFFISFHVKYDEQECYLQTHTTPSPPCRDRPWWLSGVKSPTATRTLHHAPSCSCAPASHHALPLTKAPDS